MISQTTDLPIARLIEVFSAIQGEGLNVGTGYPFREASYSLHPSSFKRAIASVT
jgi:hypothetical protein